MLNETWAEDETDPNSKKYKGLFFHYEAEVETPEDADCLESGPNSVRFEVMCEPDAEKKADPITWTRSESSSDCDIIYESTNYAGCYIDASSYFLWVNGFSAFFMTGIGLFMIFYGARFIIWVLGAIVFFIVQSLVYVVAYTLDYVDPATLFRSQEIDQQVSGSAGAIAILILVLGVVLGILAAYYLTQHVSKVFLVYLAFQNGCILGFMLLSLIPMRLSAMIQFAAAGVVGVGIAYLSFKKLKYVKTVGTATFGSFLLAKGISCWVGGFPELL